MVLREKCIQGKCGGHELVGCVDFEMGYDQLQVEGYRGARLGEASRKIIQACESIEGCIMQDTTVTRTLRRIEQGGHNA